MKQDDVVTSGAGGEARLWNTTTGQLAVRPFLHDSWVRVVAFGPSELILTASHDGKACLWDIGRDGRLVACVKHERWISAAAFSPDGESFVTGSLDWTARRWDLNGKELNLLRHQDAVRAIAFRRARKTIIAHGTGRKGPAVEYGESRGGVASGSRSQTVRPGEYRSSFALSPGSSSSARITR